MSPDVDSYIQQELDKFYETINKPIFLEAKDLLNKFFGEENNQIIKPTLDDIAYQIGEYHHEVFTHTVDSWNAERRKYLLEFFFVYIRFPNIHITNGRANKGHDIRDLWVRFKVTKDFSPSNLQGARSYLTYAEASVGYHHSHLPHFRPVHGDKPDGFNYFCLGSGEILQSILVLTGGFNNIDFSLFCLHLKNYVVWESIEGTPHIRYSKILEHDSGNIQDHSSNNHLNNISESALEAITMSLKKYIAGLDEATKISDIFNPFIVGDQVTLEIDETMQIFLGAIISIYFDNNDLNSAGMSYRQDMLVRKDSEGKWIRMRTTTPVASIKEPKEPIFEFKGKPVYLKIEGIEDTSIHNQVQNNNTYAHPAITQHFANSFKSEFAEVCFEYQENIQKNTLKNLLQTTGPNLLSV